MVLMVPRRDIGGAEFGYSPPPRRPLPSPSRFDAAMLGDPVAKAHATDISLGAPRLSDPLDLDMHGGYAHGDGASTFDTLDSLSTSQPPQGEATSYYESGLLRDELLSGWTETADEHSLPSRYATRKDDSRLSASPSEHHPRHRSGLRGQAEAAPARSSSTAASLSRRQDGCDGDSQHAFRQRAPAQRFAADWWEGELPPARVSAESLGQCMHLRRSASTGSVSQTTPCGRASTSCMFGRRQAHNSGPSLSVPALAPTTDDCFMGQVSKQTCSVPLKDAALTPVWSDGEAPRSSQASSVCRGCGRPWPEALDRNKMSGASAASSSSAPSTARTGTPLPPWIGRPEARQHVSDSIHRTSAAGLPGVLAEKFVGVAKRSIEIGNANTCVCCRPESARTRVPSCDRCHWDPADKQLWQQVRQQVDQQIPHHAAITEQRPQQARGQADAHSQAQVQSQPVHMHHVHSPLRPSGQLRAGDTPQLHLQTPLTPGPQRHMQQAEPDRDHHPKDPSQEQSRPCTTDMPAITAAAFPTTTRVVPDDTSDDLAAEAQVLRHENKLLRKHLHKMRDQAQLTIPSPCPVFPCAPRSLGQYVPVAKQGPGAQDPAYCLHTFASEQRSSSVPLQQRPVMHARAMVGRRARSPTRAARRGYSTYAMPTRAQRSRPQSAPRAWSS